MVIAPEILVTPDRPVVRFREPREKLDLDKELKRVLQTQGWGVGTYFNVQFISHDRTELLSQGEFIVIKDAESLQTNNDDQYSPKTQTAHIRVAEQIGEFREFGKGLSDLEGKQVEGDRVAELELAITELREARLAKDGSLQTEQVDELSKRVVALEERKKPGPKPKSKVEGS